MIKNRCRDYCWSTASAASVVPTGFILVSTSMFSTLPAQAAAAQLDLYRLAYQTARETVDDKRRIRRWMFRAAQAAAWN